VRDCTDGSARLGGWKCAIARMEVRDWAD